MAKEKEKKKSEKSSVKNDNYQSLMGSPMDVADHPANNVPHPFGGAFSGLGLGGMPMGGPADISQYGA